MKVVTVFMFTIAAVALMGCGTTTGNARAAAPSSGRHRRGHRLL